MIMANFLINTETDVAVRKSEVVSLCIIEKVDNFELRLRLSTSPVGEVVFETAETLEAITAKASSVIASLEE